MNEAQNQFANDVARLAEATLGLTPNTAQFHAYDEHQQPVPEPLTAAQYAESLINTNSRRPQDELKLLAKRYRDAFTTQRTAVGITAGQLAHLFIAAEVLEWLVEKQPTATATPLPSSPKPSATPQPKSAPNNAPSMTVEPQHDLEELHKQLLAEFGLADTSNTIESAQLQQMIQDRLKAIITELDAQLSAGAIIESERDAKLQQERRNLERRAIELQSIEARLQMQQPRTSSAPQHSTQKPTEAIETLRRQEHDVLAGMNVMEKLLDTVGLPPKELKHIRHQLTAVEELMKDIEEETR